MAVPNDTSSPGTAPTTVLVTGSSGRIGSRLVRLLPEHGFTVRTFDRRQPADTVADLFDEAALDQAMAGADSVVHLAGQPTEGTWEVVRNANIDGAYAVFEAARRAGVQRMVFASSNHAVGYAPRVPGQSLPADTAPRPDTLYGVSKVFGEALGRYYHDRYAMRVACLRIGTFAEEPMDRRSLATWLSPDDCARLVAAALRDDDLGYALIWGVSANRYAWWSSEAGERHGYFAVDDAAERRPDLDPPDWSGTDALVGGGFTDAAHGIDEIKAARPA